MRIAIVTVCLAALLAGCDLPQHETFREIEARLEREEQAEREKSWPEFEAVECKFPYETRVRITDGFYRGQVGEVKRFDVEKGYTVQMYGMYGIVIKNVPSSAMEEAKPFERAAE